ncbi:hypothetical protein Pcinc_029506 [Petrolisthes cinctipes]|uniref:Ig-like domain-containing protein n=1 Tax=Petrolisthes cinctipes TaxID=88211 RepID=A0AAE1F0Q9_PETCI|nr:hypothetical protein Pcinc_029506 [Petrolisthes cinctipes]
MSRIKYLTLTETDKIWMPDLFFKNEKTGHFHNIILPNTYIRIFPNGNVLYSIRISLTLSCPMDLKLYPLDTQICELRMASYGWTTEDLLFKWKENEPIQVTKELHLPRFTLEHFETKYCNSKTNTGEYSCLMVNLTFKREFSYYLIQYYIPCCMLVIVSWVSFWLDQHAVPARVALGVTTLLTMSTQTAGINQSLPPVSYTKAIDVWTGMCLTFVFSALLEFALVNYASRSDMQREKLKLHRRYDMETQASFESGMMSATPASTSASPHHHRQSHHDPSAPSTSNHRHRPPHYYRHNSFGAEHDSPFNDYGTLVRETHPLVPPYPHDGGGGGGGGGGGSGVVGGSSCINSAGGPMNRLCEVHIQGHPNHHSHTPCTCFKTWLSKFPTKSKRIDVIARITFPLFFALFNVCYWSAYISKEESGET